MDHFNQQMVAQNLVNLNKALRLAVNGYHKIPPYLLARTVSATLMAEPVSFDRSHLDSAPCGRVQSWPKPAMGPPPINQLTTCERSGNVPETKD